LAGGAFHVKQPADALIDVSRETGARLRRYADLLLQWNRTINLVSRGDEALLWERHIADSLALIPAFPDIPPRAIDLGSGGGCPGLVLAIATGCHFDLIESDHRKCAFLREAARLTAAPATVHACRIEDARVAPAPLVTARALAPLDKLLQWAIPLLTPNGVCLFPKGRTVDQELTAAALQWHMRVIQLPSPIDPASTILRISEIARVGS
jgi:16S rRNA (guanine527-N7)-methyltransferase